MEVGGGGGGSGARLPHQHQPRAHLAFVYHLVAGTPVSVWSGQRCVQGCSHDQPSHLPYPPTWLPAGTYRITRMLEIWQSNVVLRGEGVSAT